MASTSNDGVAALRARIEDSFRLCDRRQFPCFYGFLDLTEQAAVRAMLAHEQDWLFYGGYPEAERQIFAAYPSYMMADEVVFPLCSLAFHYRPERALSHRDFLGTLLSVGLRREKIGDILCGEGLAVVYIWEDLVDFVCDQITKIGGEGVRITPYYDGKLPLHKEYKELTETVASPRLDGIVKALLHCSREEAARLVRLGYVSVDHVICEDVAAQIAAPCTVSVKGSGRYLLDRLGPPTKKGRLAMSARKCI